jgi:hypothetical protein
MATNQALIEEIAAILRGTSPAYNPNLGVKVERPAEAIAITVSPGDPYFTVAGGLVLITALVGVCTATFGGVANTLSFVLDPTAATGANTNLTGATDIGTATVVGDVVAFVGAPATGPVGGHLAAQVLSLTAGKGVACMSGIIGLVATAAVGTMRWVLFYQPIDTGATVVVA